MVTLRELTFDVLFKDRATKALKRTNKQMDRAKKSTQRLRRSSERLERQQKSLKRSTMSLGASWKTFAGLAIVGIAANAIKNLGKEMVSLSAKMEMTRVGFEVMLGSKGKAKSLISDIKKFSLATPFTPEQLFQATEQLLAFNFSAEEILPTMKLVGDISKGSSDKFRRLSFALAEVRANSRLMGQEARQMINAGFSPVVEIAKLTGESILEVRKRMEEGKVSFDEVRRAMVAATSKGGKFFRAMDRGAQTTTGLASTLEGVRQEIFIALGDQALAPLKQMTKEMIQLGNATLRWLQVAENAALVRDTMQSIVGIIQLTVLTITKLTGAFFNFFQAFVKFGKSRIGMALTSPLKLLQPIINEIVASPENLAPRSIAQGAVAGGPGGNVVIPKLVENVTIHANSRAEGEAAAEGFMDMLDAQADKLKVEFE